MERPAFGSKFGEKYFAFQDGLVNLNQGSFGAVARPVMDAHINALQDRHAFPDKYYRGIAMDQNPRAKVRAQVAELVNADPENCVLVFSATTAFNAALREFPFDQGDKVLYMSSIYVNDINTMRFIADRKNIELVEFVVDYPREPEHQFLKRFREALRANKPRVAIFDTVSSMPSDVFPWEHMCEVCHEEEVLSFVDGAHGIGLISIDLRKTRPTWFCSNLHKWYNVSQGANLFYVDPEYHKHVKGFPISAFDSLDDTSPHGLAKTFGYMSTMDYAAMDSIPAAIEFRKSIGGEAEIIKYQNDLSREASKLVCESLGVKELVGGTRCAMFTTESPLNPPDPGDFATFVGMRLMNKWNTYIPLSGYHDRVYIRWSATIYLDIDSFRYGIKALKECFEAYKQERNFA